MKIKNKNSINILGEFLSKRDLNELSIEELMKKYSLKEVDVLVLLGSAITYNIKVAVEAYEKGLCKKILICGGIGHSTVLLRDSVKNHKIYNDIEVDEKAEADIILDIMIKHFNIPIKDIITENKSTNCGDNAKKAIELLENLGIKYKSLMLIQDPTMQLRSYLSFLKYIKKEDVKVINYSPFIPHINENREFDNSDIDGIWSIDRFEELIVGEIPRLRDDENGYGPKGAAYIEHIDIPVEVEAAYKELSKSLGLKTREQYRG